MAEEINDNLSKEHIEYIKERIEKIEASNQKTFSWEEVKEQLENRWNSK